MAPFLSDLKTPVSLIPCVCVLDERSARQVVWEILSYEVVALNATLDISRVASI